MPRGDGTGPQGQGPGSGKGQGSRKSGKGRKGSGTNSGRKSGKGQNQNLTRIQYNRKGQKILSTTFSRKHQCTRKPKPSSQNHKRMGLFGHSTTN